MLPLLLACGWRLARAPRFELLPAVVGVAAAVVFAGSHNLSLLLGTVICGVALIGLRLALGPRLAVINLRRAAGIVLLLAGAVAVDAWFLLPDVLYGPRTRIATYGLMSCGGAYTSLG